MAIKSGFCAQPKTGHKNQLVNMLGTINTHFDPLLRDGKTFKKTLSTKQKPLRKVYKKKI